ncbi:hypothetical protein E4T66_18160 [Sinimarinibacterium sp. CAU 1509]|uniref:hypothetical protein n=1 Tax=Sinimarinibacterium sp. CAU 1509 TaxID=2562283 RepID=UPI0010AC322D|nr:hypothetical protein [Sinimarinibacterium sp. CAU 1509]TJY57330.1 hypothetical protein E4T66_18160 [Sinimarinibacterium sp. CAU 1509]
MASGTKIRRSLDDAVEQLQSQASAAAREVARLRDKEAQYRQGIARCLSRIAVAQASAFEWGELQGYDSLTEELARALAERAAGAAGVDRMIEQEQRALTAHRDAEQHAQAVLDQNQQLLFELHEQSMLELRADPVFVDLNAATSVAADRARAASEKASSARSESEAKVKAFYEDALFMYLRDRAFGTGRYQANRLVRAIDSWLAGLCNFSQASRDLDVLEQLPGYLEAHAQAMAMEHQQAASSLDARVREHLLSHNVETLEGDVADAQSRLTAIVEERDACVTRLEALQNTRRAHSAWSDSAGQALLEWMSDRLGDEAISRLRDRAARTRDTADDDAVEEVESYKRGLDEVEREIPEAQARADELASRVSDLTHVRQKYRRKGFDSSAFSFPDARVGDALHGYLLGSVTQTLLWDALSDSARHTPSSPSSGGSSHSGFGSGGGFSSGGGFGGGGGFSTGGGF